MAQQRTVSIDKLLCDPGIQPRVSLTKSRAKHYAEQMKDGEAFPPIDVFSIDAEDGHGLYVADGCHRVEAAKIKGADKIRVNMHYGTRDDAIRFAVRAHAKDPKNHTNADKRKAVGMLLKLGSKSSDRSIAKEAGVSNRFVGEVRKELEEAGLVCTVHTRIGADGVEQPAKKTKGVNRESAKPDANKGSSGETGSQDGTNLARAETPAVPTEPAGAPSTEQAEQRKPPKNGRERVSTKERREAGKAFGVLNRFVDTLGNRDEPFDNPPLTVGEAMNAIYAEVVTP